MDATTATYYRSELRKNLGDRFSESELRDLCFDLGIDYESLAGANKPDKARELVIHCERHDRLSDLVTAVEKLRPDISSGKLSVPSTTTPGKVLPLSGARPSSNPYWNRRAIRAPEYFFGRSYEVRTALSLLANAQSISLVGPSRAGKSSLLYYISNPSVLRNHVIDPEGFAFILLSCEQLSDLGRDQILQVMLNQARATMNKMGFQVDVDGSPTSGMTFFGFSNALGTLTQHGRKLIFLLDEFEYLAENSSLAPAFFAGLRSIAGNLDVAYVTVSRRSLLDLTYADKSVLGSPFFNIFSTIRLGLFEDKDARELISGPSRAASVEFSEATVDFIVSLADHHPFFLQIACFHAFEIQSQKGILTQADYRSVQARAWDGLQDHLKSAWGHLKPEERRVLWSLETAQNDPKHAPTVKSLHDQGVICRSEDRYRLCTLWADFLSSQRLEPDVPEQPHGRRQPPTIVQPDVERV